MVTIIDIHQLNLGPFGSLKFLVENSLEICFKKFCLAKKKTKYFMYLKKKAIPNERERDFIVENYIFFRFLLFNNVL
jgi:hypothetical protein